MLNKLSIFNKLREVRNNNYRYILIIKYIILTSEIMTALINAIDLFVCGKGKYKTANSRDIHRIRNLR